MPAKRNKPVAKPKSEPKPELVEVKSEPVKVIESIVLQPETQNPLHEYNFLRIPLRAFDLKGKDIVFVDDPVGQQWAPIFDKMIEKYNIFSVSCPSSTDVFIVFRLREQ